MAAPDEPRTAHNSLNAVELTLSSVGGIVRVSITVTTPMKMMASDARMAGRGSASHPNRWREAAFSYPPVVEPRPTTSLSTRRQRRRMVVRR